MGDWAAMDRDERIGTIVGHGIVWAAVAAVLIVVWLGISWTLDRDRAWEIRAKEDCVVRGGKVTEQVGGFTRFSCVGPTTFK